MIVESLTVGGFFYVRYHRGFDQKEDSHLASSPNNIFLCALVRYLNDPSYVSTRARRGELWKKRWFYG